MAKLTTLLGALATFLVVMDFERGSQAEQMPAVFGVAMFVLGFFVAARNEKKRMSALHTSAIVAALGFLSTLWWLVEYVQMVMGRSFARTAPITEHALASLVYLLYVLLYLRSLSIGQRRRG